MTPTRPFSLRPFQSVFVREFHAMTFPAYAAQLSRDSFYGVEAWAGGQPAGLALANQLNPAQAELLSVFVEPGCRRQGLGRRLIEQIQADSRSRGIAYLETVYMTGGDYVRAAEHILAGLGWSRPKPRMLVLRTTLDAIRQASWLRLAPHLPPGFIVTPWAGLAPGLKQDLALEIRTGDDSAPTGGPAATSAAAGVRPDSPEMGPGRQQAREPWIPGILSPFRFEAGHDPVTSMALLHEGRIRGWLLSHRVSPDSVRFSCAYVHPRAQGLARLIPMIAEAVRRFETAGYRNASWAVSYHQRRMIEFMDKHFAPYSTFRGETRGSAITLA